MIYTIKLPQNVSVFPQNQTVIGGEARLAAWCLINKQPWPNTYRPRDQDFLREYEGNPQKRGILFNEGTEDGGFVVDRLVVSSLEDYFYQIDLHTNQVAVVNNEYLKFTEKALKCFARGVVTINWNNPKLKYRPTVSAWEYLALRACIQTGWDVSWQAYWPRAGACKLHPRIKKQLDQNSLAEHWYWEMYQKKLAQIKTGLH